MKPILVLVRAASSYRLQQLLAKVFVREGRAVAYVYEGGEDDTFEMIRRDAVAQGATARALESAIDPAVVSGPLLRRSPHPWTARALNLLARAADVKGLASTFSRVLSDDRAVDRAKRIADYVDLGSVPVYRAILGAQLAGAARVISEIDPAAMVSCEDGISTSLSIHAAARASGVPVVEVPYGYGTQRDLEIALENKAARGELVMVEGREGRLVQRYAPQWIKRGPFAGALMFPAAYILAAESLGITLRDAWIIHGGYADRLCAESEQMLDLYRSEGIPEKKLRLTGTPYCDAMVAALDRMPAAKAALRQPRRIEPLRTRILVSWPPSYHRDRGDQNEFPTYREMSAAVLGFLRDLPDCEVTVSLHPATPDEDRQAVIDAGISVSDEFIIELIPQHDVFVTYFSSTIRWAVAAGKPVVNYDAYRVALEIFVAAPGVVTVTTFAEFRSAVSCVVGAGFAEAAGKQIDVAPAWGLMDGQSATRILAEIDGLVH